MFLCLHIPGVRTHEEMLWPLETDLKERFPSNAFQKKGEFVFSQQLSESIPQPPAARHLLSVARGCHLSAGGGESLSGLATKPSPCHHPNGEAFCSVSTWASMLTLPTTP